MAPLNWASYLERAVGKGHPTLPQTIDRALRQMLTESGYDPDASPFPGLMGPVFNVKAFGAKGDGVTDDTVPIQLTVDTAPDYSVIWIPSTHLVTSRIDILGRKGLHFRGPGTIKFSGINAIRVADGNGIDSDTISFYGLGFDGGSGAGGTAILVTNAVGSPTAEVLTTHVRRCHFVGCPIGVDTSIGGGSGPHEVMVYDNVFEIQDVTSSIAVRFQSHDNVVRHNVIKGYETGISLPSSTTSTAQLIQGNHIYRFPSSTHLRDMYINCNQVQILGNYFDGVPTHAQLYFPEAFNCRGVVVNGNYFLADAAGAPCIKFDAAGAGTNVAEVSIQGNIFAGYNGTKTNTIVLGTNCTTNDLRRFAVSGNVYNAASVFSTSLDDEQKPSFSTPFTPDPTLGRTIHITLSNNITINGEANQFGRVVGTQLRFIFLQDGTGGRTVAWNAVWKQAWSDAGNTANKRSAITYEWNGSNWSQVEGQAPYV